MKRLIAFKKESTLCYVVPDDLGGTLSVGNADGVEARFVRYNAFGSDRAGVGRLSTDKGFTRKGWTPAARPLPGGWTNRTYDPNIGCSGIGSIFRRTPCQHAF